MASSSSSSSLCSWSFNVFTSFHGPDVRKTFLSHLREQFNRNGISMFDDERIERGQTIAPELMESIGESRIAIVLLSKNYASSSWCLDELLEILKCKEDIGQIVMTVFYGVDPSDVRKQTGDFGEVFNETCARYGEEERRRWSKALNDVGNIAGEHFFNWVNEAKMIAKIAKDVLQKLNATPCRDFEGMVGLDAHLTEMESLLELDYGGVKMVAITGPAGIGKTTIARALHSLLSTRFQLTCFVDNLREIFPSGFDEYGWKKRLQEIFLSKILNHEDMRICHLGAIKENICDQKVLIVLDDVNNLKQLEALANETAWFGPGSRIVVTTEDKELLQQHGIDKAYHVGFPSRKEALEILCRYAFRHSYPRYGFEKSAERVRELCGNLPLALRVVGSSLRGKTEDGWEDVINRLKTILDREIEDVLKVGYESLDENEQTLFLHIAVFFNNENCDTVKAMFSDGKIDVKRGLQILVYRSLIEISRYENTIEMHKLLRRVGRQAIRKQEPWKRQILLDAHEICDVLENETGTQAVSGISFDISGINDLIVDERAFKRMYNLQFLKVYKSRDDKLIFEILDGENRRDDINDVMHIPEEMKFPRRLRFLHWNAYPNKCFPPTFNPGYLVELDMMHGKFEYLWKGTQRLTNLKKLDLSFSCQLKELPDLSNAINLKRLDMSDCKSLVEIPSSFLHLQKLELWWMDYCVNLQIIPDHLNLASLVIVEMNGCSKLRKFLFVSTTSARLRIWGDSFRQRPPSSNICSRIRKSGKLKGLTHLHKSLKILDLRYSDIETIPDCIKALHQLEHLSLDGCRRLASLPELPGSIKSVNAEDCESLETVFCPLNSSPFTALDFTNCFKLGQLARREIIHRSFSCERVILPGRKVPAEFDHRARGSSLTITSPNVNNPLSAVSILKLCVVVSPNHEINKRSRHSEYLLCHCIIGKGDLDPVVEEVCVGHVSRYRSEHLLIFQPRLPFTVPSEVGRETVLEFSSKSHEFDVSECGARVFEEKSIQGSYESEDQIDYLTDGRYESCEDDISRLIDESIELNPANTLQATRHESSEDEWSEDEYELSEEYRQSRREFRTQCRRGSVSQWTDRGILSPVVLDNADAAARNFKLESSIIKSEGMELGLLIL